MAKVTKFFPSKILPDEINPRRIWMFFTIEISLSWRTVTCDYFPCSVGIKGLAATSCTGLFVSSRYKDGIFILRRDKMPWVRGWKSTLCSPFLYLFHSFILSSYFEQSCDILFSSVQSVERSCVWTLLVLFLYNLVPRVICRLFRYEDGATRFSSHRLRIEKRLNALGTRLIVVL